MFYPVGRWIFIRLSSYLSTDVIYYKYILWGQPGQASRGQRTSRIIAKDTALGLTLSRLPWLIYIPEYIIF